MLAVFDLDGTLLDGDSTALWLARTVARSPWRLAAALLIAPIALPLVLIAPTRRAGASLFLWIATAGRDEAALRRSFADFADRLRAGALPLRWRPAGLAAVDAHLARGETVVIATAAPNLLAEALVGGLGRPIRVFGSSLKPMAGGWVADQHCRHQGKCVSLAGASHGPRWAYAYSDSVDDLPLLRAAERPALINGGPLARRRLVRAGLPGIRMLVW